ncbi:MAG: Na+/H+ antiporter NhaA, partial [Thermodesulfobacteriota bacterium]|nr:Na+/H+ antiporter NhaA [Thermodesulfobacteriota bacterium]
MKLGVRNVAVYLGVGLLIWFGFHESGIHATIAGVIVGLLTPTNAWISEGRLHKIVNSSMCFLQGEGWSSSSERYAALRRMERAARKTISPLERFETDLHPWVGFVIMPVFALANAGVTIQISDFTTPVAIAVIMGLFVGKPVGIVLFSWIGVKSGLAKLPEGVNWSMITGGGFLAGIGFTMAIFIASLALDGDLLSAAKVGILAGSVLSAVVGVILLVLFQPKHEQVK